MDFLCATETEKLSTRVLEGRSPRESTILVHSKASERQRVGGHWMFDGTSHRYVSEQEGRALIPDDVLIQEGKPWILNSRPMRDHATYRHFTESQFTQPRVRV